jgi:hypothetical protein
MPSKKQTINVKDTEVSIIKVNDNDYISLTDMVRNIENGLSLIEGWLRNKNTIEYLGVWEQINNPNFNSPEFAIIKNEAGTNRFTLSVKKWSTKTNGVCLVAKTGRYGSGTYAHRDIAFEFGSWLSPEFKFYLIKEFQRLKEEENSNKKLEWNLQRTLAKVNYKIHTDSIKENLIPNLISKSQTSYVYASEGDLLNVALFGKTAKEWREENNELKGNIRDYATLEQLIVLSNLESVNSMLIAQNLEQKDRLEKLNNLAIAQMKSLVGNKQIKKLIK